MKSAIAPVVVAGLLSGACVPGPGGGGGGRWQPTADDEAFLDQVLSLILPCCMSRTPPIDPSSQPEAWKADRIASGFSRDPSLRAACLAELGQLAGMPNCVPLAADFTDPCVRVFSEKSGPQPAGASCVDSADCQGSPNQLTVCLQTTGRSYCVDLARGDLGSGPCVGQSLMDGQITIPVDPSVPATAYYCDVQAGLYCDTASKSCATLLAGGKPCTSSNACASTRCLDVGTCAPVVSAGQTCAQTAGPACDTANYCDPATSTCLARLAAGATCTGAEHQCLGNCGNNAVCSPVTFAEQVAVEGWCLW